MIRQIIWDFDGVIVFSDEIRVSGFREVLKTYPETIVDKVLQYHQKNGGLSRYDKFRYMFSDLLNEEPDETKIAVLANRFSDIMKVKMANPKILNPDAMEFLEHTHGEILHHIASGSDGRELRFLCDSLRISKYFSTISGSPETKTELVRGILEKNYLLKDKTCLIGDSFNDLEAARRNGIIFWGYNNEALRDTSDGYITSFNLIRI